MVFRTLNAARLEKMQGNESSNDDISLLLHPILHLPESKLLLGKLKFVFLLEKY
jgi:hypothetical protein